MKKMDLDSTRKKIDAVDERLVKLLNRRASLALRIAKIKDKHDGKYYVPEREAAVLRRVKELNEGPLPSHSLVSVFREIMGANLCLESPLKVAYLGPEATFSHQAAVQKFGRSANYEPVRTIDEIFDAVEHNRVSLGVVPAENSIEGVVSRTLDRFSDSRCTIIAEHIMSINENLIGPMKSIDDVKKVCSHPQPLAQCARWIEMHLPQAAVIQTSSTADAALRVKKEKNAAAIASAMAAEIYNLNILAGNIEDFQTNVTRFLVISMDPGPAPTGHDKTSILLKIHDKPGALHDILGHFASHGVNLTKLESRPTRERAWDYQFFIDMYGHHSDKRVKKALKAVHESCDLVKLLGSYPIAEPAAGV